MALRLSVCSSRRRSSLHWLARVAPVAALLAVAGGCQPAPSPTSAADLVFVRGEPRCPKLGVVEGVGGNDEHARQDALAQAALQGATHVRLEPAHPDVEDGMTIVVTCTMFKCAQPGEVFPPNGYP